MIFWLVLAVVTAGSLALVIRPLLARSGPAIGRDAFDAEIYRDQLKQIDADRDAGLVDAAEAEAARIEVSRRLLATGPSAAHGDAGVIRTGSHRRAAAFATLVGVPALALGLYLGFGAPGQSGVPFAGRLERAIEDRDLASLIAQAEAHLREHPDDARGWRVLAPAYLDEQRFSDAANAYARVIAISGKDAELLTSYGEALVLADGGLITEAARAAFQEALGLDATALRARFYLGLADRQDGRAAEAIAVWEQILAEADADAAFRPFVEAHIADARQALGAAPDIGDEAVRDAETMSRAEQLEMIEGMVAGLAARLEADANDLDGWLRLINAYVVLGRRDEAAAALVKARDAFAADEAALARLRELAEMHQLQET
jgi:cytochrome c-type biogenesis protein CcmH